MQKIAVTGSSGYFGRKLIAALRRTATGAEILGLDVMPADDGAGAPDRFVQLDVRDAALLDHLREFAPDTVIHLAFIVNPIQDEARMHDINIGGTRNVLDAVAEIQPARFFVASSATAYGAFFDNPVPMDETWPVRPRKQFAYAADKTEMDWMIAAFADAYPDMAVAWVRPAIIYGPNVENYLSRTLVNAPVTIKINGYDLPLQFVHEDDVVAATLLILQAGARGPFNLAPPDWMHLSEIADVLGKRCVSLPFAAVYALQWALWRTQAKDAEAPPGILYFFRYPWVVAPKRLQDELDYSFQYTTRQTLQAMVDSR